MSRDRKKKTKEFKVEDLKQNEEGKYILPLKKPVKYGPETIKELLLDEPKAKHLRTLSGDPNMDEILKIVADLANQPDSLIDELSMGDATNASEFFGSFE